MKAKLKCIIGHLNPKLLSVDKVSIGSFKKLGIGEGNLNYLFQIKNKKFICRVNIDKNVPNKSKKEYNSLKKIEKFNIAPKVFYYHPKDEKFPYGFIILEFIDGQPFRMKKRNYTREQIKQLAFILAKLHSKKFKGFQEKPPSFKYYLKKCKEHIRTINSYNSRLKNDLSELIKIIGTFLPKKEKHKSTLIHGDVCPQNIVETKNGLKLIDWESLQYSDPAKDITNVLIDLEFKNKDLDLFFKEYHKIRKDSNIMERARIYEILFRAVYFLWELTRTFEIINKKLPKEYLKKTTAQRHINEAKFQFRKLSKLIDVPKINIDSLFTNVKN